MRKLVFKIIGGIISTTLLFSTICFAATEQELKNKVTETEEKLNGVQEEKSETQKEVDKLTTQIDTYEEEIDKLNGQIDTLNTKIEDSQNKIKEAEENYKKQDDLLEKRLVASYMSGETSYLDFLLSSDNIVDMISNYYLVSKIADADTELLEQIETQKNEIEEAKKELEANKQELATSKASKQSVSTQLQTAKNEKNQQIANLSEEEKDLQTKLDQYKQQYLAEQERIRKAAEEAARHAQENQNKGQSGGTTTNPSSGGVVHNGQMKWPCPNYTYISSYFGGRTSPGRNRLY